MVLSFFILAIFAATMLTAVYKDVTTMTIPNWASLLVLAGFFMAIPFVWQGWANFGEHLTVGATMFALGFAMFAVGAFGGGDAKLMAATSFWWMWPDLVLYVFYTTLAGGALSIFMLVGRNFIPASVLTHPWLYNLMGKDNKKMPYGLALAFGALVTLPQSHIFQMAASSF